MPDKTYAALSDTPEPRTAAHIAMMTKLSLDATLFHLRQLEDDGMVRHTADERGVVRWERSPRLGSQVFIGSQYRLTPAQQQELGI